MYRFTLITLFVAVSTVMFTACSEDDPVQPQEEHFEPEGMVFRTSGIELFRVFRGETVGKFEILKDSTSDPIHVTFLDENETEMEPPSDDEKKLAWAIDNPDLIFVFQHSGEEGGYEFHLEGLEAGSTKIEFFIQHAGHNDFRSGKITVNVK